MVVSLTPRIRAPKNYSKFFVTTTKKKRKAKFFDKKKRALSLLLLLLSPVVNKFYYKSLNAFPRDERTKRNNPPRGSREEKARARGRKEGRNVSSRRGRSGAQTRRGVPKSAPRPRPTRRSISPRTAGESDGSARERPRRGRRAQTTFVRIRTHEESRETPRSDGRIAVAGDAGRRRRDERPRVKERCRMSDVLLSPHKKSFNR